MVKLRIYKAVVVGTSMGGLNALKQLLAPLPASLPWPIIIVQHVSALSNGYWIKILDDCTALKVSEAEEKEMALPGHVYFAPPNYHLLIEKNGTFSLSADEKVSYARPSIDVLFESASDAYKEKLIGIVLTGANSDGALGLKAISDNGGLTIVQDPTTAEVPTMPEKAYAIVENSYVFSVSKIVDLLIQLGL